MINTKKYDIIYINLSFPPKKERAKENIYNVLLCFFGRIIIVRVVCLLG